MKRSITKIWVFLKCVFKELMSFEFVTFLLLIGLLFYIAENQRKQNEDQFNRLLKSNFYSKYCNVNAMEIDDNDYNVCKKLKAKLDESLKLPDECSEFDPKLIKAIKQVESSMNHKAIGDGGNSYGLMQVKYETAKSLGYKGKPKGLLEPQINMKYGCLYLSKLLKEKKDIYRALDSYNRGPGAENNNQYSGDWKDHKYVGKIKKELKK